MMSFSGRIARQDAERAEKSRWLALLATLLAGTDTPLGRRLVEKPAACNSMGLCLRSGTLRNRVNALRRYFTWLASSYRVPFPCVEEHVLDYVELKVQEPCTRVSLKVVHQSPRLPRRDFRNLSRSSPHSQTAVQQPPSRTLIPDKTGVRAKASTTPPGQSLGSHREDSGGLPGTSCHPSVCVVLLAADVVLSRV